MPYFSLASLLGLFQAHPTLAVAIDTRSFLLFLQLLSMSRSFLAWQANPYLAGPPPFLPPNFQQFYASVLSINVQQFCDLWSEMRVALWDLSGAVKDGPAISSEVVDAAYEHGVPNGVGKSSVYIAPMSTYIIAGVYNLHPPTRFCVNQACQYVRGERKGEQVALTHLAQNAVTCFSREHGPVPAVAYSMTCPSELLFFPSDASSSSALCLECDTRYTPAYFIDQRSKTRAYYPGIPRHVHVATHVFIEASICERFTNSSACAW